MIFFSVVAPKEKRKENAILESGIKMDSQMPFTIDALGGGSQ